MVAGHQVPGLPRPVDAVFPELLNLASPFAQLGLNFFNTMECHMRHMNRLFGELQRRHASTFEVTEDANAEFLDRMTGLLDVSVFYHGDCATSRSYYFDPGGDERCCGRYRRWPQCGRRRDSR